MVNINLTIPDDVHKYLKLEATIHDKSLKELIITILDQNTGKDKKVKRLLQQ